MMTKQPYSSPKITKVTISLQAVTAQSAVSGGLPPLPPKL